MKKYTARSGNSASRRYRFIASLLVLFMTIGTARYGEAHNLQTKFVYMFFDPDTIQLLDDRMSGATWLPPEPLLKVNDELGMIIKLVPRDGTTTGVGGHLDFYVPDGNRVYNGAIFDLVSSDEKSCFSLSGGKMSVTGEKATGFLVLNIREPWRI
ncbi:MAG: hypothetical protein WBM35_16810 [Candidatus Electrothrix sp.]